MKKSRVLYLVLAALFAGAGALSAESLPTFLAEASPEATVTGLVQIEGRADLATVRGDSISVMAALKAHASETQAELIEFLRKEGIEDFTPFWVSNVVAVKARPDVFARILDLPSVEEVRPNTVIPLPDDRIDTSADITGSAPAWGVAKVGAPRVWEDFGIDGDGVVVGVIDTGVDASHPDLAGKVIGFKDFVEESEEPVDGQGHGTHVCGTIAGGGSRAIGVAPKAKLIVARVFTARGGTTEGLLAAMQWIMNPDGDDSTDDAPRLVSNSWGSDTRTDKSFWDVTQAWRAAGIHPVFAAGNSGPRTKTVGIPGGYPHVTAVGATTSSDRMAFFSSRGPVEWDGQSMIKPDISAPGASVISAKDGGGYTGMSGTSMACPHISGILTLMYQANPGLTIDEANRVLEETSIDLGRPGRDNDFGEGRADAYAAISRLRSTRIHGSITDEAGNPLPARVEVVGTEQIHEAQGDGTYELYLTAGTWTVRYSLFGYAPVEKTVEASSGGSVALNVTMPGLARARLIGRVRSGAGAPVTARVIVMNTPLEALSSGGDNGLFDIELPVGEYTLKVIAMGYEVSTFDVIVAEGDNTADFVLEAARPYMLVDDDGGQTYEDYYRPLLSEGLSSYRNIRQDGAITSEEELAPYHAVIWFTGDRSIALTSVQQAALKSYLHNGGRLFLSGQNLARTLRKGSFLKDVLHAGLKDDDTRLKGPVSGIDGDPIGEGLTPFTLGGAGAVDQKSPDAFEAADDTAVPCLRYKTWVASRYAGLRVDTGTYRAVYTGFGLEGIADTVARGQLLARSLDWLAPEVTAPRQDH